MKKIKNFKSSYPDGLYKEIFIEMTNDKAELKSSNKTNLPRQKFLQICSLCLQSGPS